MRMRTWLLGFAIISASMPVLAAAPACAGQEATAALVVDLEDEGGVLTYCVALDASTVSGAHLIELAGEQFDLSYRFGYGGQAVCMLAGVGTEGDDCFAAYPNFWGYWRGDGSGSWSWSGAGSASTTVGAGDIEGWSWGSGNDGSTHPSPPATTYGSVCGTEAPHSRHEPTDERHEAGALTEQGSPEDPGGGTAIDPIEPDARPSSKLRAARDRSMVTSNGEGESRDVVAADAPVPPPAEQPAAVSAQRPAGPPIAGVVGVGMAALLALGASMYARRRRS